MTINKQLGYEQCGVLIPNTYFDETYGSLTRWARENEAVSHDVVPFSERRPVAFYRGALHHDHDAWSDNATCASPCILPSACGAEPAAEDAVEEPVVDPNALLPSPDPAAAAPGRSGYRP